MNIQRSIEAVSQCETLEELLKYEKTKSKKLLEAIAHQKAKIAAHPIIKQNIPRILFEILVYGESLEKNTINRINTELTKQMDSHRNLKSRCRVLWYIDSGEKSVDEKKQWLIENAKCKYCIFVGKEDGGNIISPNFIKLQLEKIKKFEQAHDKLKHSKILVHSLEFKKVQQISS